MLVISKCQHCEADRALPRCQQVPWTADRLHVRAPYTHTVSLAIPDGPHPSKHVCRLGMFLFTAVHEILLSKMAVSS